MLKNVETVVFMEDYQVQEILEVKGYDVEAHDFIYRPIYKNPKPRYAEHSEEEENKDMGDDGVFIDTSDIPDFSSIFEEQTAKQS